MLRDYTKLHVENIRKLPEAFLKGHCSDSTRILCKTQVNYTHRSHISAYDEDLRYFQFTLFKV